ncbi:MAG: TIGR00730 family Rossman fold protein [Salinivirgaceae bacterium]|jgi:uncharacterized protein (TIGR00730 family)|nr:TIGR00730 family Rossman fold protein [Salinivirgaceae bacterium]
MKQICVYCSSNLGANGQYIEVANRLGTLLAKQKLDLVYGGANVGLMRATAEKVLEYGGKVTGVITHFLAEKHLTQQNITQLITVETMQERKAKMAELADGFIVLPGGFGTLEELFEILTAGQLGFHSKPVAIINTNNYYSLLKQQLELMVQEKMLLEPHAHIAQFVETPEQAIEALYKYEAPVIEKWIDNIRKENGHSVNE